MPILSHVLVNCHAGYSDLGQKIQSKKMQIFNFRQSVTMNFEAIICSPQTRIITGVENSK